MCGYLEGFLRLEQKNLFGGSHQIQKLVFRRKSNGSTGSCSACKEFHSRNGHNAVSLEKLRFFINIHLSEYKIRMFCLQLFQKRMQGFAWAAPGSEKIYNYGPRYRCICGNIILQFSDGIFKYLNGFCRRMAVVGLCQGRKEILEGFVEAGFRQRDEMNLKIRF